LPPATSTICRSMARWSPPSLATRRPTATATNCWPASIPAVKSCRSTLTRWPQVAAAFTASPCTSPP